jgi:hypothetical protein
MVLPPRPGKGGGGQPRKFYSQACAEDLASHARIAARFDLEGAKKRSAARQKGKADPKAPPPPRGCETLWSWFRSLDDGRPSGGFGPALITYRDIADWSHLTGIAPSPLEVKLLLLIDRAYIGEVNRINAANKPTDSGRRR